MGSREIFRRRVLLLIGTIVCVHLRAFSAAAQEPSPSQQGLITTFAPIVEKVAPSVVTVFTTQTVSRGQTTFPFGDDTLRQFFGGQLPQGQGKQTLQGLGSGVIVSPDGYILTGNHVVSGAEEIMIGLGNELRKFKAKKIGTDPGTDVALLKIDENNLPAVNFADSEKARAGDVVLAIGNPFGLRQTVTMGIISAVGRGGIGIVDYENFIQTDAAVNMGNSGGALVDAAGRLLGINTAIFSRSGGNQGVGFAIPANLARDVMQSLREKGRVVRGYIGASVQTLTPELAEAMKLKGEPNGALVGEVTPKSPSEKATVCGGVAVADVTDEIRNALNLSKDIKGAVIAEIDADSPAAKAGLREGDVIQEVNKQPVKNAKDLVAISKRLKPDEKIRIRVWSQGRSGFVALEPK